jgi:hypothetical protein
MMSSEVSRLIQDLRERARDERVDVSTATLLLEAAATIGAYQQGIGSVVASLRAQLPLPEEENEAPYISQRKGESRVFIAREGKRDDGLRPEGWGIPELR